MSTTDPSAKPPLSNAMIEDFLAHATTEDERAMFLETLLMITVEYAARQMGKRRCRETLQDLDRFVRDARPVRPWED